MKTPVVSMTEFKSLTLKGRGKVRDIYDLGDRLLIVATDRISAFDVVMPNPIPDKGRILTQLSRFWFDLTREIIPNHIISTRTEEYPQECRAYQEDLRDRSMLVLKTDPLPVECVVRVERISEDRSSRRDPASQRIGGVLKTGGAYFYSCH